MESIIAQPPTAIAAAATIRMKITILLSFLVVLLPSLCTPKKRSGQSFKRVLISVVVTAISVVFPLRIFFCDVGFIEGAKPASMPP